MGHRRRRRISNSSSDQYILKPGRPNEHGTCAAGHNQKHKKNNQIIAIKAGLNQIKIDKEEQKNAELPEFSNFCFCTSKKKSWLAIIWTIFTVLVCVINPVLSYSVDIYIYGQAKVFLHQLGWYKMYLKINHPKPHKDGKDHILASTSKRARLINSGLRSKFHHHEKSTRDQGWICSALRPEQSRAEQTLMLCSAPNLEAEEKA